MLNKPVPYSQKELRLLPLLRSNLLRSLDVLQSICPQQYSFDLLDLRKDTEILLANITAHLESQLNASNSTKT